MPLLMVREQRLIKTSIPTNCRCVLPPAAIGLHLNHRAPVRCLAHGLGCRSWLYPNCAWGWDMCVKRFLLLLPPALQHACSDGHGAHLGAELQLATATQSWCTWQSMLGGLLSQDGVEGDGMSQGSGKLAQEKCFSRYVLTYPFTWPPRFAAAFAFPS